MIEIVDVISLRRGVIALFYASKRCEWNWKVMVSSLYLTE